jgi:hypothetical protein
MFNSKKYLIIIVMVVLAIAAVTSLHMQQAQSNSDVANVSPTLAPTPTPTQSSTPNLDTSIATSNPTPTPIYKNGTYTAAGNYQSPGGTEEVSVTLTLSQDTITDASVSTTPASGTSEEYQSLFKSNYKNQVVGKALSSISLSRVSGSSLTSSGFNQAVSKIKSEAHS